VFVNRVFGSFLSSLRLPAPRREGATERTTRKDPTDRGGDTAIVPSRCLTPPDLSVPINHIEKRSSAMPLQPKTIAEHIECLARLTGAPASFVTQVRDLFFSKGIPLETDADPYLRALEEAFRREESIRATAVRARRNIDDLHRNFDKIGRSYVRQLEDLKQMRQRLEARQQQLRQHQSKPQRTGSPKSRRLPKAVVIGGNHRSFITKTEREDLPMVPGPKEPQ